MTSYQTTLARAAARDADRAWRRHRMFCSACDLAARERRYADLCPEGAGMRHERRELHAAAEHEAKLDKLPPPGQAALFGLDGLP
jgi:hypothetical protein